MNDQTPVTLWEQLRELSLSGDALALQELLASLKPAQAVRAMFRLRPKDQQRIIALVSPQHAADLLEDLPEAQAVDLLESLDAVQAADIVEELPSAQSADLLAELDDADANAILEEMAPVVAGEVRDLIVYPGDVAGGLMGPEYYAYPETYRVQDFRNALALKRREVDELPQRILLLDESRRLTGAVDIVDVLLVEPLTALRDLRQPITAVSAVATLEELEAYFDRYDTLGVPVVDKRGVLVGRLRRHALFDAIAERAQDDQLKFQGIIGGEELRTMPVFLRSRRRLSWLSINILLNIVAASVIAVFQDTLTAVIALAVFLPIVSDMSGCSGNQAVAVSMRELTLGIIEPRDVFRVWWQEAALGVVNGVALGILLSLAAYLWQGNPVLGLVVGAALALNTMVAVSIGGTVPLLLKRLRADPAVASGPVLTTVTDMCGFFLLLGLATLVLPWLT